MTRVIKKVFDILFILIIVALAGYFVLRSCKVIEVYNVKTGSMEEDIHIGDYVLIMSKNDYDVGDIITFKREGFLVTHRIIKKNSDSFITKGDANNEEDGPITINQIVGKVIISGGFLNIIIKYKYALASIFISLYLISCYLLDDEETKPKKNKIDEIKNAEDVPKTEKVQEPIKEELKVEVPKNEDIKVEEKKPTNKSIKKTELKNNTKSKDNNSTKKTTQKKKTTTKNTSNTPKKKTTTQINKKNK